MSYKHIFCYLLMFTLLISCKTNRYIHHADSSFAQGGYSEAAQYYRKAYNTIPAKNRQLRGKLAYQSATCYRLISLSNKAIMGYTNAIRYHYKDTLSTFYLAEMQRMKGDYKGAIKSYETCRQFHMKDSLPVDRGIASCQYALSNKPSTFCEVHPLSAPILSRRSEYAPCYIEGQNTQMLYFTSTRTNSNRADFNPVTGQLSADIYVVRKQENNVWQRPEALDTLINTRDEEGACTVTPDGMTMYFTRCITAGSGNHPAMLYKSQRSNGKWGEPTRLQLFTDTLSSIAHPAISPDGQYLYFTSDYKGGFGGKDLWRISLSPDPVGVPVNLGADINTDGDEMFPSFSNDGSLYFASNGRIGFGGLDIYKAIQQDNHWLVSSLPVPINSSHDDFGITLIPTNQTSKQEGFFSSNRNDQRGYDHLFSFVLRQESNEILLSVIDENEEPIPHATLTIANNQGLYKHTDTDMQGHYTLHMSIPSKYIIQASAKGYISQHIQAVSDTLSLHPQEIRLKLLPTHKSIRMRDIYFGFGQSELLESSFPSLNKLVSYLQENPKLRIEIFSHCDYKGSDEFNLKLSQQRAEVVLNYLISNSISMSRLNAKGFGKSQPKVVTAQDKKQAPFLTIGTALTESFILSLPSDQQEICNTLNRRTEIQILPLE